MEIDSHPLRATRYIDAVLEYLEPAQGSYIYHASVRDLYDKTSANDRAGFVRWLRALLPYLERHYDLRGKRVLDIGCGLGEFTVIMNLLGYQASGVDVQEDTLRLGRLLADENGQGPVFVRNQGQRLPFADNAFDIVTMIAVLEHIDDGVLAELVPEIRRVCRGVVYIHVPNRVKATDDHTGLRFVPWMPRRMAEWYVRARGSRYRYHISALGSWDVYYRGYDEIVAQFRPAFDAEFPPAYVVWPPSDSMRAATRLVKSFRIGNKSIRVALPVPWRSFKIRQGYPEEAYYPYLNIIFVPRKD